MQKADMDLVVERRICLTLGDPSTILLRKIAYGTAQDDSVFLRAHTWVRPYVLKATFLRNRGGP